MADKATGDNQTLNSEQGAVNEPQFITSEQLNSAITARLRAFETKQTESFTKLESMMQKMLPQEHVEGEAKPLPKKLAESAEYIALQNQVAALEAKNQQSRHQSLRAKTQEALLASGVNPKALKPLLAMLVDADKTISYAADDSDEILFRTEDSHLTLRDGLSNWVKSEEAKAFLAPTGATGSGDKPYNQTIAPAPTRPSSEQFANWIHNKVTGQE